MELNKTTLKRHLTQLNKQLREEYILKSVAKMDNEELKKHFKERFSKKESHYEPKGKYIVKNVQIFKDLMKPKKKETKPKETKPKETKPPAKKIVKKEAPKPKETKPPAKKIVKKEEPKPNTEAKPPVSTHRGRETKPPAKKTVKKDKFRLYEFLDTKPTIKELLEYLAKFQILLFPNSSKKVAPGFIIGWLNEEKRIAVLTYLDKKIKFFKTKYFLKTDSGQETLERELYKKYVNNKIVKKEAPKKEAPKPQPKKEAPKPQPKKEAPKQRPRRRGKTTKEIEEESYADTIQDLDNAIGALEIGKLDPFEEDGVESQNRVAFGFYLYRNIKKYYKDDKNLNKLTDEFKKLVIKRKNTPLMKESLKLNKISTSTGTRLSDTKKDINKIYNELINTEPKKEEPKKPEPKKEEPKKEEPKKPEPKKEEPKKPEPPKPKQDKKAYEFYNNLNDFLKGSKRQINYLRKNFNIDDKTIDNIFEGQEYKDFYPTPKECIDKFNIRCNKILEGTAGLGSVAFWLREKYPDLEIVANELSPDFIPLIKKFNPSIKVINKDFFKLKTKEECIFLNPPFSRFGKGGKSFGGKGSKTPFYFDFLFPDLMKNQRNSDKGTETFFINEILGESKTGLKNIIGLMEKYGNIKTNEKEMKIALKEYGEDPSLLEDILDRNPDYGLKNVDSVDKIGTCKGFGGTGASASMYEIRIF